MSTFNCSYTPSPAQLTGCPAFNVSYAPDNKTAYAIIADKDMGGVGKCLANSGLVFNECVTKSKERRGKPSGAAKLGIAPLFVLVLAFLAATASAAVTCKQFDASDRSSWDWNAFTPNQRLGARIDCTNAGSACGGGPSSDAATFSAGWQVTNGTGVSVDAKLASVVALVGGSYAEQATSVPVEGLYVPRGQLGWLTAYTYAVAVGGTFRDCSDGAVYAGSALVPDGDRVVYRVVLGE
ncbi:uncharacterized protein LOC62_02G002246 [Vanrija pseudolonga]|uniref:Uncharacterized protein n=1 Tax=Vanrija pseudolonga TaxID=143232 RepID=A0AAF0Y6R7_9TREE|nr:hypothetical protein LOC62_02G002246 [Vanrija pseudolonga]